jgi:transcriptional regulator with XRE-family HTH domain
MDGKALVTWNLRRLRVAAGVSQEQLAIDAGVDRTYVGRIERGLENPTVNNLDKLAAALSVEIGAFFVKPRPGERRAKPLRPGRRAAD